jgi:hypothetical protein
VSTAMIDLIERITSKPTVFASPYEAGRDAAINGPNTINTSFKWFTSKESTKEWERGNRERKEK